MNNYITYTEDTHITDPSNTDLTDTITNLETFHDYTISILKGIIGTNKSFNRKMVKILEGKAIGNFCLSINIAKSRFGSMTYVYKLTTPNDVNIITYQTTYDDIRGLLEDTRDIIDLLKAEFLFEE